jgi:hypothetical protein
LPLRREISLPGEVHPNQDRLAHIVPRYAGQKLALHASKMGDTETLKTHCEKIRAALHDTA